jgi:hypothetical protein
MKSEILEIITQHKFDHISSEQAVSELLGLFAVSNRRQLLFAFEEYWSKNNCDGENFSDVVDRFLANNSCQRNAGMF